MTSSARVQPAAPAGRAFERDKFTLLAYVMIAFYAYHQNMIGPLMPHLRAEMQLNYTEGGLHVTALALGTVLAGLLAAANTRRLGRHRVFWGGGLGLMAGAALLALGRTPLITVPAVFMMLFLGTHLLITIQAALADRHAEQRAVALTEANVIGAVGMTLPALVLGVFLAAGRGWRGALLVAGIVWLAAALLALRDPVPATRQPAAAAQAGRGAPPRLPRRFWAFWAVMTLNACAQWAIAAWSADFMADALGFDPALASTLVSAYLGPFIIGRFVGSRLTRRYRCLRLLLAALLLAACGFLLFWLGEAPAINVGGLFLAGLGMANLYPLGLSVATGLAPEQSDQASARVALGTGTAILAAPLLLGAAADQVGIRAAFAVVVALLGLSLAVVSAMQRRPDFAAC